MTTTPAQRTGADGEALAEAHLVAAGLVPHARNIRFRHGELDLVMDDAGTLVFVEVRRRRHGRSSRFGGGVDSISAAKRARLIRAAQSYLASDPRLARRPCRFDVIAIADDAGAPSIEWLRNAFEAF